MTEAKPPNPDEPIDRGDDEALLAWQQNKAADEAAIEAYYEAMGSEESGHESQKDDKRPAQE